MRKNTLPLALLIAVLFFFSSCATVNRAYYFRDLQPGSEKIDSSKLGAMQKIQNGDGISVVISSKDPALTAYLNPLNYNLGGVGSTGASQNSGFQGYHVDSTGSVSLPLIGKVAVTGLSTVQAAEEIRKRIEFYFKDPFVSVALYGRVSVLTSQNGTTIPLFNERLTIFEALSQAGNNTSGLDVSDRRNKIWVIREDSGKRIYARIDLNKKEIFNSPYYYLRNNDLVYIEPSKYATFVKITASTRNFLAIAGGIAALIIALKK